MSLTIACYESIRSALKASLSVHDRCSYRADSSVVIKAVSEIVTMENLSDVEIEDTDDEPFEFNGRPYLFEPVIQMRSYLH